MKRIFQILAFAAGMAAGPIGIALLILSLWLADQQYMHFLDHDIYIHDFTVSGMIIPTHVVVIASGIVGTVCVAFSVIVVCRNNPFVQSKGAM